MNQTCAWSLLLIARVSPSINTPRLRGATYCDLPHFPPTVGHCPRVPKRASLRHDHVTLCPHGEEVPPIMTEMSKTINQLNKVVGSHILLGIFFCHWIIGLNSFYCVFYKNMYFINKWKNNNRKWPLIVCNFKENAILGCIGIYFFKMIRHCFSGNESKVLLISKGGIGIGNYSTVEDWKKWYQTSLISTMM